MRPAVVAMLSAVLVLAGCGGQAQTGNTPTTPMSSTTTEVSQSADDAPAPVGTPVPEQLNFSAKTVDGQEFSGASLAGKPALLWFWAPWCPKCQAEAPTIAEAA